MAVIGWHVLPPPPLAMSMFDVESESGLLRYPIKTENLREAPIFGREHPYDGRFVQKRQ